MNWIYLSKNLQDQYINMFAQGCGSAPVQLESWRYEDSIDPIVIRGIMKHKIFKRCWQDKRRFRYMDTGYFGNRANPKNPNGWKLYHRIVENNLQHDSVRSCAADRWERLGIMMHPRRRGRNIIIVMPEEKPCIVYDTTVSQWLESCLQIIRSNTDRPIVIRERNKNRQQRENNSFEQQLADAHAVVVFNSIAATESVLAGVPAFVCAPCNAADPVSNHDLTQIEDPWFPDTDQITLWARSLAYGQFHVTELRNGTALRILEEMYIKDVDHA